jgi:hypothetical protein
MMKNRLSGKKEITMYRFQDDGGNTVCNGKTSRDNYLTSSTYRHPGFLKP